MSTDSSNAEKRFYTVSYPSARSRQEEIDQLLRDYVYHDSCIQELGRYRGFFHVIERRRIGDIIERYCATQKE